MLKPPALLIFLIITASCLHANAGTSTDTVPYQYSYSLDDDPSEECTDMDDPFEKFNRKIFAFNSFLDHIILRPVAKGYKKAFNPYIRDKIGNFVDNTSVPLTFVNNVLQLDAKNSLLSFWQFVINSTLGVGGFYDVARSEGVWTPPQTFGSTLARYGSGPGPYIILPFFGGSGMRDVLDLPLLNSGLNPLKYKMHRDFKLGLMGVSLVHQRAELLDFTDHVTRTSADPYSVIRSTIFQHHEKDLRYPAGYKCKRVAL